MPREHGGGFRWQRPHSRSRSPGLSWWSRETAQRSQQGYITEPSFSTAGPTPRAKKMGPHAQTGTLSSQDDQGACWGLHPSSLPPLPQGSSICHR